MGIDYRRGKRGCGQERRTRFPMTEGSSCLFFKARLLCFRVILLYRLGFKKHHAHETETEHGEDVSDRSATLTSPPTWKRSLLRTPFFVEAWAIASPTAQTWISSSTQLYTTNSKMLAC